MFSNTNHLFSTLAVVLSLIPYAVSLLRRSRGRILQRNAQPLRLVRRIRAEARHRLRTGLRRRFNAALVKFLASAFTVEEFTPWIIATFAELHLEHELKPAGAAATYFHDIVELLTRHGVVGPDLFIALTRARPYRADEIEALTRYFHDHPTR